MTSYGSSPGRQPEATVPTVPAVPAAARRLGLSRRGERNLTVTGGILLVALALGWSWSIVHLRGQSGATQSSGEVVSAAASMANAITSKAPTTAFLTDATLNAIADRALNSARGVSGKLKAAIEPTPAPLHPDSLPPGGKLNTRMGECRRRRRRRGSGTCCCHRKRGAASPTSM